VILLVHHKYEKLILPAYSILLTYYALLICINYDFLILPFDIIRQFESNTNIVSPRVNFFSFQFMQIVTTAGILINSLRKYNNNYWLQIVLAQTSAPPSEQDPTRLRRRRDIKAIYSASTLTSYGPVLKPLRNCIRLCNWWGGGVHDLLVALVRYIIH